MVLVVSRARPTSLGTLELICERTYDPVLIRDKHRYEIRMQSFSHSVEYLHDTPPSLVFVVLVRQCRYPVTARYGGDGIRSDCVAC